MLAAEQTCYRHHDRRAGVSCQRCDRPICPQCMSAASVGFHCPECTRSGRQRVYTARSLTAFVPWVTYTLLALNIGAFVAGIVTGGEANVAFDAAGGFFADGALNARLIAQDHEWWRLLTSGFLHLGLLHLAMNMYALFVIGPQLERGGGRLPFAIVYLTSLLAGSLGALIVDPFAFTAGASGAIFGLMGGALVGQRAAGVRLSDSPIVVVVAINLLITFGVAGISKGGHIGGLVGGLLVGWVVYDLTPRLPARWLGAAIGIAIAVGCFVGGLYVASNPVT